MHQINIKRADLLVKIKENRDIHAAEYKEAYAAFKEKAKAGLLNLVSNHVHKYFFHNFDKLNC